MRLPLVPRWKRVASWSDGVLVTDYPVTAVDDDFAAPSVVDYLPRAVNGAGLAVRVSAASQCAARASAYDVWPCPGRAGRG